MTAEKRSFVDEILANAEATTLVGDLRDAMLLHLRNIKVPWAKLKEDEQRAVITNIQETAQDAVRRAVEIIAADGFPYLQVRLGKWTVHDGAIKLEVNAGASSENIVRLAKHQIAGILVFAEMSSYFGERAPAKPDLDQPDLPIAAE